MNVHEPQIVTTGTGASGSIDLGPGLWSLTISAATWGEATLQHSADGTVWDDSNENGEPLVATSNRVPIVRGGLRYRLNVASHASAITLKARRLSPGAL